MDYDPGESLDRRRPSRAKYSFGRRRTDLDPRNHVPKNLVIVTVVLVNALYLAGEALLYGHNVCP